MTREVSARFNETSQNPLLLDTIGLPSSSTLQLRLCGADALPHTGLNGGLGLLVQGNPVERTVSAVAAGLKYRLLSNVDACSEPPPPSRAPCLQWTILPLKLNAPPLTGRDSLSKTGAAEAA